MCRQRTTIGDGQGYLRGTFATQNGSFPVGEVQALVAALMEVRPGAEQQMFG